jgi:diguanylate cyclase (GGDEF)-like protein/PAS domain S-box-containing protein
MLAGAARSLIVEDARADLAFAARATTLALGIGAYSGVPLYRADGRLYGTLCTLHPHARTVSPDETRLLAAAARVIIHAIEAEEALHTADLRYQAVIESAHDAIIAADSQGRILSWNTGAAAIFGYRAEEVVGQSLTLLMPSRYRDAHQHGLARLTATGETRVLGHTVELHGRRKDGSEFPLELSLATWTTGDAPCYSGIIRDITARTQAKALLAHQATHDALTDLPNRTLLHDRLDQALRAGARHRQPLALLLLDLDRFKEINDTFGHHHGDLLVREVGQRVRAALRASDTLARLGGDEFAVLLPATDEGGAVAVAGALLAVLDAPLNVGGQTLHVGASIGIALCPAHGADTPTLLRHVDVAMYTAKRTHSGYAFYDAAHDQFSPHRLALVDDLRQAIANGALVLHYQPQVEVATGRIRGVEALVRWPHPRHGLIPPDQFIPLAEQTGLIASLTHWVVRDALRQARVWRDGSLELGVAVNLSMWDLHDPLLPDTIAGLLRTYGLPPAALCLELTESALMADAARALDVLARLRALGVRLAIDDFGTGYSSLSYLKRLPVDELKIDQSFVRRVAADEIDATLVASILGVGHGLGLTVVAEGVEDRPGWELLARLGCDTIQGYYLSRPLPADALAHWARTRELDHRPDASA